MQNKMGPMMEGEPTMSEMGTMMGQRADIMGQMEGMFGLELMT